MIGGETVEGEGYVGIKRRNGPLFLLLSLLLFVK